jgi:anti-sigma regulatory factor (Ser/Thr protein kinase)
MKPIRVLLPGRLDFAGVQILTSRVNEKLLDASVSTPVVFDMKLVQWTEPVGIVGLACLIEGQRRIGREVHLDHNECAIAGYWDRMGFFREVGHPGPVSQNASHPPAGRFAEVRKIHRIDDVDGLAEEIISCLNVEEGEEEWHIVLHIVTEALNNVCQHSGTHGFCAAQYWPSKDRLQICIGDCGVGLKHALTRFGPDDDAAALDLALQVGVTGRPPNFNQPGMRNRGVGLSCIDRLTSANQGRIDLWSGLGRRSTSSPSAYNSNIQWTGTLLMANMRRNGARANFEAVMAQLREELYAIEKSRKTSSSREARS